VTLDELRAEARKHDCMLVHKDRIRTATVSSRISKMELHRMTDREQDHRKEVVRVDLRQHLADFLIRHDMATITELPHEWDIEFRADLQVLGPKTPHPDDSDHFIFMPRGGEVKP